MPQIQEKVTSQEAGTFGGGGVGFGCCLGEGDWGLGDGGGGRSWVLWASREGHEFTGGACPN